MTNIEIILSFHTLLKSKKIMQEYWKEKPYALNFLINQEVSFLHTLSLVNKQNPSFENKLIPLMKVYNGDDLVCLFEEKFYLFKIYDKGYNDLVLQFSTPQEVWEKVIKPDIEDYYGIKIDE